jgi:GMP synthase (glutamine-hydrolysing)
MFDQLQYLLLQVRNEDDPMRNQEVRVFARALHCSIDQIQVLDLLDGAPTVEQLHAVDVVLLGGSGDYSVVEGGAWFQPAAAAMYELFVLEKPTFASCWGFQAMARALDGRVISDPSRAELGTCELFLTTAGQQDPVFGALPERFQAQVGHQDIVVELPSDAVLLASSDRVTNQAFRLEDKPIYCTQFHPELNRKGLIERLYAYPNYVEKIAGVPFEEFLATTAETPETEQLLPRFVEYVFGT